MSSINRRIDAGRDTLLSLEQVKTEIQVLIKNSISKIEDISSTKAKAKDIISKFVNEALKEADNTSDKNIKNEKIKYVKTCEKSLNDYFLEQYSKVLKTLKGLSATNALASAINQVIRAKEPTNKINSFLIGRNGKTAKGEMTAANLRNYLLSNENAYGQMIIDDYRKKVNATMMSIAESNPTVRKKTKTGKVINYSIRNIAEYIVRKEEIISDMKRISGKGIKFVLASQHIQCSERCEPYQGLLYLVDVEYNGPYKNPTQGTTPKKLGTHDGRPYYSLRDAVEHGFLGYNCRHRVFEYIKGMTVPKPINPKKIEKERAIDMRQRRYERDIREAKHKQSMSLTSEERSKWIDESKRLQAEYKNFSFENGQAIYPWRCAISYDEKIANTKIHPAEEFLGYSEALRRVKKMIGANGELEYKLLSNGTYFKEILTPQNRRSFFNKNSYEEEDLLAKNVSSEKIEAVKVFTENDKSKITSCPKLNSALFKGTQSDEQQESADKINSLISINELDDDYVFFRGENLDKKELIERYGINDDLSFDRSKELNIKGFQSSTYDIQTAVFYAFKNNGIPVINRICARKGTKVMCIEKFSRTPSDKEVLFPMGTIKVVTNVSAELDKAGRTVIIIDEEIRNGDELYDIRR